MHISFLYIKLSISNKIKIIKISINAMSRRFSTLKQLLDNSLDWKWTGNTEKPYTAKFAGNLYFVRINNFPPEDNEFYSVFDKNHKYIGGLETWPLQWQRKLNEKKQESR
jgi:hypothetical protein